MNNKCPKCGGNKIEVISNKRYVISAMLMGFTFCVFIITIPLGIISFVSAFAMMAAKKVNKCHECKKIWKYTKETAKAGN
jgi:Zn finger protein HypA/HybF involved in hydrogenase expression